VCDVMGKEMAGRKVTRGTWKLHAIQFSSSIVLSVSSMKYLISSLRSQIKRIIHLLIYAHKRIYQPVVSGLCLSRTGNETWTLHGGTWEEETKVFRQGYPTIVSTFILICHSLMKSIIRLGKFWNKAHSDKQKVDLLPMTFIYYSLGIEI
jgi:hypothetical protein